MSRLISHRWSANALRSIVATSLTRAGAASVPGIVKVAVIGVHELIGELEPAFPEHFLVEPANYLLALLTAQRGDIIGLHHVPLAA